MRSSGDVSDSARVPSTSDSGGEDDHAPSFDRWGGSASPGGPSSQSRGGKPSLISQAMAKVGLRWTEEETRALERVQNATLRGAAIGFVLRGGYVSFSSALSVLFPSRSRRRAVSAAKGKGSPAMSVLRWTAFLGSLGGTYVALDEGLMRAVGKQKSRKWRGMVSGTVAGSSIALLGRKDPQYAIAIYVYVRALWLFLRRSRTSGSKVLRTVSAPLELPHADILVMCLSCTQILYAWLMEPRTLPVTYRKFLDKHCGKPEWVIQSIREMIGHNIDSSSIAHNSWHRLVPPDQEYMKKMGTPYGVIMQGQWQLWHHLSFFFREYKRKIPVYIPVYFLPALIVHRWKLFTKPKLGRSVLYKSMLGTMQSALFLTAFCTMAWTSTCGMAYLWAPVVGKKGLHGKWLAASLSPIGTSLICEKRSRRKEIAAYCSARALECFLLCAVRWNWIPKKVQWKRFDIVLFSAGVGLIMHCYGDSNGDYRYTFRSKYLNVIDFVFGNTGHKVSRIRHVPSTSDLVRSFSIKKK